MSKKDLRFLKLAGIIRDGNAAAEQVTVTIGTVDPANTRPKFIGLNVW